MLKIKKIINFDIKMDVKTYLEGGLVVIRRSLFLAVRNNLSFCSSRRGLAGLDPRVPLF